MYIVMNDIIKSLTYKYGLFTMSMHINTLDRVSKEESVQSTGENVRGVRRAFKLQECSFRILQLN
jgi:negative regulator of sigma E activity